MSEEFSIKQEAALSVHVFSVSAAMVGVCLTVIGIFSIISSHNKTQTIGDDLTALAAILFLGACVISYVAMKFKAKKTRLLLEKTADIVFLAGLVLMAVICFLIVYVVNQQLVK